ncbi:MAG: DUF3109 family protein [Bacteroidetes bacterium]|jgi:hypothetical protein|nr:DUF3109 family protein [Bacteroidota bacterium]
MLLHQEVLISLDVLEKEFVCNLQACKGACCVEGEYGAPLRQDEVDRLKSVLEQVRPYMEPAALAVLDREGFSEWDGEGELSTKCLPGGACVFATKVGGMYQCAIELAHKAGAMSFRKPISCHLYPIREVPMGEYVALNYHKWHICQPACKLGKSLSVPVHAFLAEALTRRFGQEWYQGLVEIAREYEGRAEG